MAGLVPHRLLETQRDYLDREHLLLSHPVGAAARAAAAATEVAAAATAPLAAAAALAAAVHGPRNVLPLCLQTRCGQLLRMVLWWQRTRLASRDRVLDLSRVHIEQRTLLL